MHSNQSLVVEEEQRQQNKAHDKGTRWRKFQQGDQVCVRNFRPRGALWLLGGVTEMTGPVSYKVHVGMW